MTVKKGSLAAGMSEENRLQDKPVVLVTGASGGIGRATARLFAERGYLTALQSWRHPEAVTDLCREACFVAGAPLCFQVDLTKPEKLQSMVDTVLNKWGRIDVLVNNAGRAQQKLITDVIDREWDDLLALNLSAPFYTCRAVLPDMIRRQTGCIINISSIWGRAGASMEVAYSATKAGLIGLTKALAKEVGPSGIRVNCITPGVIDTAMNEDLPDTVRQDLADQTPLGRLGQPEEVAAAIYYLASAEASFISGQILGVDGAFI